MANLVAIFEECCWEYDEAAQLWILPYTSKSPAIPVDLIMEANICASAKTVLIEILTKMKTEYDADNLIEPILERLKTSKVT